MVGKTCKQITYAYGNELYIEIGEIHTLKYEKYKITTTEWMIGTRGTGWHLFDNNYSLVVDSESSPKVISHESSILVEMQVTNVDIKYPELWLEVRFNNLYTFRIQPTDEDAQYEDIAYWQVFTPDKRLIQVGPGLNWTLQDDQ